MTKKEWQRRCQQLVREVERMSNIKRINGVIENANLPKCESELCRYCVHCRLVDESDRQFSAIIGCSKHLDCKDFTPLPTEKRQVWML